MRRIGCLLARSLEPAGARALLEAALAHSPRVESAGPGLVYLDLTGLRGLYGEEREIGGRLRRAAGARGLSVSVGIAGSRASARLAACGGDGVTVIPPGEEAAHLAPAPLSLLDLPPETAGLLGRWGIRTLGELAALPAASLFERLGPEGLRLRALARGEDPRPLHPYAAPPVIEESVDLEWDVEGFEQLAETAKRLVERICARLARERLSVDRLEWSCRLADRSVHEGECTPAVPTRETAGVVALVLASLESRLPPAGVTGITLRAHPVRVPLAQDTLTDPVRPAPRALAETLAKLAALVGAPHVGVPMLLDSHRPDALGLAPFPPHPALSPGGGEGEGAPVLALRRLRPPRPAAVRLTGGRPVHLRSDRLAGAVVASAGPWRTSGEWWLDSRWLSDEWDVELADGTLCRLAHDGSAWAVSGIYD